MTKKIFTWIFILIPGLMIIMSGAFKLSGAEQVVTGLTKVGVGPYIFLLGLMEIIFGILFIIPKTSTIGFLLLICYFSGAMATDLSHGNPIAVTVIILVLLFVATYLRRPALFLQS